MQRTGGHQGPANDQAARVALLGYKRQRWDVDPDNQESKQELRGKFNRITENKEEHGVAVG